MTLQQLEQPDKCPQKMNIFYIFKVVGDKSNKNKDLQKFLTIYKKYRSKKVISEVFFQVLN